MDELTRDPQLARALAGLQGDPPAVEWDALRARVAAQAELPLARRRRARTLHRGVRALVPLAAAAGIAAVTLTSRQPADPALTAEDQAVVEEILSLSVPDQVDLLITGRAAEQAMLEAASEGTGNRE